MKVYVAAKPVEHDSQPMKNSFPRLLLFAALASALPVPLPVHAQANAVRLPALGDASAEDFSVGTERRLAEQIMQEVRRDPAYFDDPLLLDHVHSLWAPLLASARARGHISAELDSAFAWESFLVRDRAVNAFALPGGYVGVHLGLIGLTATRDELASVLAHELTHVTQRHIARSIASANRQSLVGLAAMVLGLLAASRASGGSGDAATQAVIVGGQAAMAQGQLNFSRDMEREADRVGFGVHQDAGFAAAGMAAMFERLDHANRLVDNGAFPYLRSHPLTVDRIGEARTRLESAAAPRAPLVPTLDHLLMQSRARVLMDTAVQSLRRWQAQDGAGLAGGDRVAALYGSALASLELREPARAQATIDIALAAMRDSAGPQPAAWRALVLAQAQAQLALERPAQALAALDALAATPHRLGLARQRPLMLARAQAALALARGGDPSALRASTEALQTWVAEHRQDALAWSTLGQSAELQGLKLRSLRAQAEAQAAGGDLGGAIDRLRAAQREARSGAPDFIEASIIDARLRDLTAQRRAQLAELRGERGAERAPP
jgi:beta-barrel assembly-enhancing protease